jgi:hypothetical protein
MLHVSSFPTFDLPIITLQYKVSVMETNWAADHLQTIRTLMERSAVYRRALAPIMILCGILGVAGGIVGWVLRIGGDRDFVLFWSGVAVASLVGSFLLVRRQALKDSEPFWSPPTRRVGQALLAPLAVGFVVNALIAYGGGESGMMALVVAVWACLYGCALHSAGFFMARGIKLFGWIFIALGSALLALSPSRRMHPVGDPSAHLLMAASFGGLHLAYGVYLYFTERKNAA